MRPLFFSRAVGLRSARALLEPLGQLERIPAPWPITVLIAVVNTADRSLTVR